MDDEKFFGIIGRNQVNGAMVFAFNLHDYYFVKKKYLLATSGALVSPTPILLLAVRVHIAPSLGEYSNLPKSKHTFSNFN